MDLPAIRSHLPISFDITLLAGFEVFTPMVMERSVFWYTTPCSLLKVNRSLLVTSSVLIYCLVHPSTLQVETTYSSETSVDFQRATRRYILEERR
jgi:hypothetical protein